MKNAFSAAVLAVVLAAPVAAFAQQSDTGLTRAQVRAELIQVEKAGYNPSRVSPRYPADIQAAMAKIQAVDNATHRIAASAPVGDHERANEASNGVTVQR